MKHISANGIRFTVADDFDETDAEQMQALEALGDYLRAKIAPLTPEQEQRQQEAREHVRLRNERILTTDTTTEEEP